MKKLLYLFTFKEIVILTGISPNKLRNLIYADLIEFEKLGGKIYFSICQLIEIKTIAKLNLTAKQIKEIKQYFCDWKMTKSLSDKRLMVFDKSVILIESSDDLTIISEKCRGQKLLGQVVIPDLYLELREKAKVENIENYQKKFPIAL